MPTPSELRAQYRAAAESAAELTALIEALLVDLERQATAAELELQRELQSLLPSLSVDSAGAVKGTAGNYAGVAKVDTALVRFTAAMRTLSFSVADGVARVVEGVTDYFVKGGFPPAVVRDVAALTTEIERLIGIDSNGRFVRGGFLDRLQASEPVKDAVKGFMLKSIAGRSTLSEMTQGVRAIVRTSDAGDGVVLRFVRRYAFDLYSQVREVKNREFADRLGLRHFVYEGSVIKSTRHFCRVRAGKAFTSKEADTWKNDPYLIDPKTRESYKWQIERGRMNCRHHINYISEAMYETLKA